MFNDLVHVIFKRIFDIEKDDFRSMGHQGIDGAVAQTKDTLNYLFVFTSSNTPDWPAFMDQILISFSLTDGSFVGLIPSRRSRVSVEKLRKATTGMASLEINNIGPAREAANFSALFSAIRLGTSSPITRGK